MERIARLVQASGALRRHIWASMPLQHRFADFFNRCAVTTSDSFGSGIYTVFANKGVADVPDPRSTLAKAFGRRSYAMLMGLLRDSQRVEDVMMTFMVRFLDSGSKHLDANRSLHEAEGYVLKSLKHEALNAGRKKREVSDFYTSEGEEKRHDLPIFDEDTAERQLTRMLPRIQNALEAIHPDAPLYVRLSIIDGYTDREILGDPEHGKPSKLPHPYGKSGVPLNESLWSIYKRSILNLLRSTFGDLQLSTQ